MSDTTTGSPDMGAARMGVASPQQQQSFAGLDFGGAGTAISDVFKYLPIVYRVIENVGPIQSFISKMLPYVQLIQKDAPGLIAEGKALLDTIAPNLMAGLTAPTVQFNVAWVQRALNKATNAGLTVDGKMGPMTHEAIRAYQTVRGLEPDTWAGPLTIAKLFKEVGANP